MHRAPPLLIIQLKRFHTGSSDTEKNEQLVTFPLDFFNPKQGPLNEASTDVYECYAIINHYGSLNGGHYSAFVRVKGEKWYLFDDSFVSAVENPAEIVSSAAYLLFYRRKDIAVKLREGIGCDVLF